MMMTKCPKGGIAMHLTSALFDDADRALLIRSRVEHEWYRVASGHIYPK